MAAAHLAGLCKDRGRRDVEIISAGLNADPKTSVSDAARAVLKERGIPLLRLGCQPLTRALVNRADVIVTMTTQQRDAVCRRYRRARLRTVILLSYGPDNGVQVPDPFGGNLQAYRDCLDLMAPALETLLEELAP
jgi:protein-tyrosine phosphatase